MLALHTLSIAGPFASRMVSLWTKSMMPSQATVIEYSLTWSLSSGFLEQLGHIHSFSEKSISLCMNYTYRNFHCYTAIDTFLLLLFTNFTSVFHQYHWLAPRRGIHLFRYLLSLKSEKSSAAPLTPGYTLIMLPYLEHSVS